jgi:hypothetical protein
MLLWCICIANIRPHNDIVRIVASCCVSHGVSLGEPSRTYSGLAQRARLSLCACFSSLWPWLATLCDSRSRSAYVEGHYEYKKL